ncbi:MAG: HAMP domain-containing sensor histidine kinase [Planctomycetota bacterium]|nr:HAMP domain-containing sensor histidine kinase [Planctomycetota bacterium]
MTTTPPNQDSSVSRSSLTEPAEATLATHDIKNLLGTVIGHADLQLLHLAGEQPAPIHELETSLESIRLSAAHAITLCEEMLALADGRPVVLVPLSISEAVTEAAEIFASRVAFAVELQLSGDDSLIVEANRTDLQRALLNLMWNAFEAMEGVDSPQLLIRWGQTNEIAWLEVVDNGPGLPEGHLSDLTEPFKSSKGIDGCGKVRGLGLHSVARVMRRHNGRLLGSNRKSGSGAILRIEFGLASERTLKYCARNSRDDAGNSSQQDGTHTRNTTTTGR